MKIRPCISVLALSCFFSSFCLGQVSVIGSGPFTITFYNNGDSDGVNAGTANWTPQQIEDVVSSVQAWVGKIANTAGRQIRLHMFWYEYGSNGILGDSYNPTYGDGTKSWTYAERIYRDGVDLSAPWQDFDAYICCDVTAAGKAWNFGAGMPGTNQYDFRSVVAHELGHTLGFCTSYDRFPDTWGNVFGTPYDPFEMVSNKGLSAWDQLLRDSSGNMAANGSPGAPGNFNQSSNPVYFTGQNAASLYGADVPVYAPATFAGMSSLIHLDRATFPDALMCPSVWAQRVVREPTALEWAMMEDMGWNIIPEPASGVLIALSGLLAVRTCRTAKRS